MGSVTLASLSEQLELADQLLVNGHNMLEPQDLPGRYGRVVKAIDHLLRAIVSQSVLAGGWAVWRHGFVGCVTQDMDIVMPADAVDELLRAGSVPGFEVLPQEGRSPKLRHKETGIKMDLLPEGGRPGSPPNLAPTTIPHPARIGGAGARLRYITLPALVELKIAAGRARDESDVVELIRANQDEVEAIRGHLAGVHPEYVRKFDTLVDRATQQRDA